jgi:hypothetical protein
MFLKIIKTKNTFFNTKQERLYRVKLFEIKMANHVDMDLWSMTMKKRCVALIRYKQHFERDFYSFAKKFIVAIDRMEMHVKFTDVVYWSTLNVDVQFQLGCHVV